MTDWSCAICLEGNNGTVTQTISFCQHKFHADCLRPWLHTHSSCPCCRGLAATQFCCNLNASIQVPYSASGKVLLKELNRGISKRHQPALKDTLVVNAEGFQVRRGQPPSRLFRRRPALPPSLSVEFVSIKTFVQYNRFVFVCQPDRKSQREQPKQIRMHVLEFSSQSESHLAVELLRKASELLRVQLSQ
eukprot:m.173963 g.173963  ORF g.173963 m.173963 type:complete len:190 (-) comp16745_c0_seq17:2100-2669(-)